LANSPAAFPSLVSAVTVVVEKLKRRGFGSFSSRPTRSSPRSVKALEPAQTDGCPPAAEIFASRTLISMLVLASDRSAAPRGPPAAVAASNITTMRPPFIRMLMSSKSQTGDARSHPFDGRI
jgi:hypothetical protein